MTLHADAARRAITLLISNAPDELHDRDRDDAADLIDPHLDAFRALAIAAHDASCSIAPTSTIDDTDLDDHAYALLDDSSDDPDHCLHAIIDALYALLYSPYPPKGE